MFSASVADQARDARQQRRRGRIHVDADRVHAVLDHRIERARQLGLIHIVLILADADRLRIDLHQLGQRILQPARDRDRAAQAHIQLGNSFDGEFRGRIDRGAGFATPRSWSACSSGMQLDQLGGQLVGFAGGGAVADADQLDAMLVRQLRQRRAASRPSRCAARCG